jgi:hypothetical protein
MKPKPFFSNEKPIKAFVLGCDPTAFDKNKKRLQFKYVFDIGGDERYFAGMMANLKETGLDLDDIFVQNLVTDYQEKETSTNIAWKENAGANIPARKDEFDKVDPTKTLPVFLTSELLYKVLLNDGEKRVKASELYESDEVVIPAEKNKLGRPLIALYRHRAYSLKQHPAYLERVRNFLSTI